MRVLRCRIPAHTVHAVMFACTGRAVCVAEYFPYPCMIYWSTFHLSSINFLQEVLTCIPR